MHDLDPVPAPADPQGAGAGMNLQAEELGFDQSWAAQQGDRAPGTLGSKGWGGAQCPGQAPGAAVVSTDTGIPRAREGAEGL